MAMKIGSSKTLTVSNPMNNFNFSWLRTERGWFKVELANTIDKANTDGGGTLIGSEKTFLGHGRLDSAIGGLDEL